MLTVPHKLSLLTAVHKLHGGGVQPNLAGHVQQTPLQTPLHGGLAVGANAAGCPAADALHMQHSAPLTTCIGFRIYQDYKLMRLWGKLGCSIACRHFLLADRLTGTVRSKRGGVKDHC